MLAFGLCWIWDVSTLPELGKKLRQIMGDSSESNETAFSTNMELDEDTKKVADALEAMLGGKK